MLYEYFSEFDKKLIKKTQSTKKTTAQKASAKKSTTAAGDTKSAKAKSVSVDMKLLKEKLNRIVPSSLVVDTHKPIDSSGFSPEGADFLVYKEYCKDIVEIMGGFVPCEVIYGTIHVVPSLNKDSLVDVINRIKTVKKLDRFSVTREEAPIYPIPSFIIAMESDYNFPDLKNDLINHYLNKNIEPELELDIMLVMNKGVMVKNWREQRSYIAVETEEDSTMSFFILMNEYLDMDRDKEMDFRKYAQKDVTYQEY